MSAETPLSEVARTIQLAVAPVFLLTSLGTLLAVFSTRLGRIVDRWRVLLDRLEAQPASPAVARMRLEVAMLATRRRRVNLAITFATSAALLVCLLIGLAFVGSVVDLDVSRALAGLFIAAMVCAVGALLSFLSEVLLAVRTIDR